MRWSKSLIPTSKEDPADAQTVSHRLMLRAGLIRQLTAGAYDFLPLGLRSLHKASEIVRQEMNAIGASEMLMPSLQPMELWRQSGRDMSYGENLFRLKDRHGRSIVLGPTHEEVVTELVRAYVDSYKQLPLTLFQIQTKFRDEHRPRFGLLRVREFLMKDAYSFHATSESLTETYQRVYGAYERIFTRCRLPYLAVEAESGPIGGGDSHEFVVLCETGEDVIVSSDKGNYSANIERAAIGPRPWTFSGELTGELTRVHTPDLPSIDAVSEFLKVEPKRMLKTLVFRVHSHTAPIAPGSAGGHARPPTPPAIGDVQIPAPQVIGGAPRRSRGLLEAQSTAQDRPESLASPKWLVAVVRGDHDVNESKLARAVRKHFHIEQFSMEDTPEARQEWTIGFVGPDAAFRNPHAVVIVDPDAAQGGFWAAGANEVDHHVRHFNWFRECGDKLADPRKVVIADIRNAVDGDPSPREDGGLLRISRGIEIGHVFKLGTKYSEALGATYLDDKSTAHPLIMGCYGIGIGRLLVAAVEAHHDERGIIWPASLAPYSVVLTPIKYEGDSRRVADELYAQLNAAGIDTILDDRDVRPGVKFADADLVGFPIRINIGERGLKQGKYEIKNRSAAEAELVQTDAVLQRVRELLACAS